MQVETPVAPPPLQQALIEADWQAHLATEQAQREAQAAVAEAAEREARAAEEAALAAAAEAAEAAARAEQLQRVRRRASCLVPWMHHVAAEGASAWPREQDCNTHMPPTSLVCLDWLISSLMSYQYALQKPQSQCNCLYCAIGGIVHHGDTPKRACSAACCGAGMVACRSPRPWMRRWTSWLHCSWRTCGRSWQHSMQPRQQHCQHA